MAKPQRMATVVAASVYVACVPAGWPGGLASETFGAVGVALTLVAVGAAVTSIRRLHRITAQLRAKA
jgi:hypothetical protein